MAKPYGKFAKQTRSQQRDSRASPRNLRIKLNGRYDLEQTSLLLQRAIARLQDAGVVSVENCAIYLTPLDADGERSVIRTADGQSIETIEIAMPVSSKFRHVA
jgi:hypothetical protein